MVKHQPTTPIQHRVAAVLLLLIAIGLGIQHFIGAPANDIKALKSELEHRQQMITRFEQIAARKDHILTQLKSKENESDFGQLIFKDKSDSTITSKMQNLLKKWARETDINITQMRIQSAKVDEEFHKLGLRVTAAGKLGSLKNWLHKIEQHQPYLFVEKLHIKGKKGNQRSRNAVQEEASLSLNVDIMGLRL